MRLINEYTPPTPDDLERLKSELGYTGNQMADLAGVASNSQWRKYTGGAEPRAMSPHILFFMAAQLSLSEDELNRILVKMLSIGASIRPSQREDNDK
ncbi:XRE family transcriptional regulator [Serratia proteamaculans]|uniref:XRE family transcriptional regulator n=1 Tax=Serratia proteamaculans TaxID=28151 RepID=UPI0021BD6314|nr:XRE family transcriptional regulator [Serratia proteamaculans]